MPIQQMLLGAGAVATKTYVDDVFSTNLYRGNGATSRTITTGLDIGTEGGMTWLRDRGGNVGQMIFDTERGARKPINPAQNNSQSSYPSGKSLTGWTTTGFTLGQNHATENWNGYDYVNWNFRKAPGFFDVVSWNGNGTGSRQISHDLGSVPGCIIIKRTDATNNWIVWHRSIQTSTAADVYYMNLNNNLSRQERYQMFNDQSPTSTYFVVGTDPEVNASGGTYVAYIFAHDNQSFGEAGNASIISCGSYTGNGSSSNGTIVNLGFEPQWVLIKRYESSNQPWTILDSMRGIFTGDNDARLFADTDGQEAANPRLNLTPTGFQLTNAGHDINNNGGEFMYIAIRRPDGYVGKPPELGTDVFAMDTGNSSAYPPAFDSAWDVDIVFQKPHEGYDSFRTSARIYSQKRWEVGGEFQTDSDYQFDISRGWGIDFTSSNFSWMFKRGRTIDISHYYATGSNTLAINHGLGGTPEMVWLKGNPAGTGPGQYNIWHTDLGFNKKLEMGSSSQGEASSASSYWSAASSTAFTIGSHAQVNHPTDSTKHYHILLFRSLAGISKVGTFEGDGNTNRIINCGFSPRFLWFKIYEGANGKFWLFDTARGWTTGTNGQEVLQFGNPLFQQEKTDWIVPVSTGFKIVSVAPDGNHLNTDGYKFMYWAHA